MRSGNLALAEVPQLEDLASPRPNLYLVPDPIDASTVEEITTPFINADSIPELSVERQRTAQEAARILSQNRHLLYSGNAEQVPTPVDALGTARQVVEVKLKHGVDSPEYEEIFTGLVLDSERLLGEAATKNKPEHFGRTPQIFESQTREYFSHGLSISRMTRNGLSPLAESEEQDRRVGEHVEEDGTYVPIGSMIAASGLRKAAERLRLPVERYTPKVSIEVTTVSLCTDYAEQDYKINPKGPHNGYRPAMKGIAIRRNHYEDDTGSREEEQVIIPGLYITPDITREVLVEKGGIEAGRELTKTELHASQFLSVNDGTVMNFVRALDKKAGEVYGKNLFMGEEVPDDHPKDYEVFIEEAQERKRRLAPMPTQLAEFVISLEEHGIDSQTAEVMVRKFLKNKLLAVAKKQPGLAEAMFDKATAEGFMEVARLEGLGRSNEARRLQAQVEAKAPEPDYCGGGSSTVDKLKETGYGNEAENETSWHGGKIYKNSKCISCEKVKPEVGACRICKDCVEHPKKHKLGTVQGRTGNPKKAKVNKVPAKIYSFEEARKKREKRDAETKSAL